MAILPVPSAVVTTKIKADQYNRLRDAVTDVSGGHDHTGAANHGKPIDHMDLLNIGTMTHAELEAALESGSVEGSDNVHGLGVGEHVLGCSVAGVCVEFWWTSVPRVAIQDGDGLYYQQLISELASVTYCIGSCTTHIENGGDWLPKYTHIAIFVEAPNKIDIWVRAKDYTAGDISIGYVAMGSMD